MSSGQGIRSKFLRWNQSDLRALAICIAIAGFIWILRSLTNEATDTLVFPVSYQFDNQESKLIQFNQDFIEVEVASSGFGILGQRYLSKGDSIKVDLGNQGKTRGRVAVDTEDLRFQLLKRIGKNRDLVTIRPDSLITLISEDTEKTVPVLPKFTSSDQERMTLIGSPITEPSMIQIDGPAIFLDTLKAVYTESFVCDERNNLQVSIAPMPYLNFEKDSVGVAWNMDVLKAYEQRVKIHASALDSSQEAVFFPDSVTVRYYSGNWGQQALANSPFKITVSGTTLLEKANAGEQRIDLGIDSIPDGVNGVMLEPGRVEFLLLEQANQ